MVVFMMDIGVCFMTSYINVASGDEIYGLKMIALNYIFHGTFMIDVISTFPLDKMFNSVASAWLIIFFKIFGFLKI